MGVNTIDVSDQDIDLFSSTSIVGNLCKFGCGQICNPGRTARGNPFDTCCRSCAISKGCTARHDSECRNRNTTRTFLSNNSDFDEQNQWTPAITLANNENANSYSTKTEMASLFGSSSNKSNLFHNTNSNWMG